MTVVKINAITVPADSGDELVRRFAARAGAVDNQDGFEGFELLKPVDGRTTWLVLTRWRDDASFEAWVNSPAFAHGHRPAARHGSEAPAGHGGEAPAGHGGEPAAGHGGEPPARVGVSSELWSYEIVGGSPG
jgi:heme-degrading monooxygenase HmoA